MTKSVLDNGTADFHVGRMIMRSNQAVLRSPFVSRDPVFQL
jgi:hypothetical protein